MHCQENHPNDIQWHSITMHDFDCFQISPNHNKKSAPSKFPEKSNKISTNIIKVSTMKDDAALEYFEICNKVNNEKQTTKTFLGANKQKLIPPKMLEKSIKAFTTLIQNVKCKMKCSTAKFVVMTNIPSSANLENDNIPMCIRRNI